MLIKAVRSLLSLALLFVMLYLGKGLSFLIPIGISDSIWGMLLLFTCLVLGIVKVEWITPSAKPLMRYMTIFFIPVCVEIIEHIEVLQANFISFVLSNLLSTLISIILIGLFGQWVFHHYR